MPELPEVERERRKAEAVLLGRRIVSVSAANDRIVYAGVRPQTFARQLRGRRVMGVRRKGKWLWLELDRQPWPLMHFGMGGHFAIYDQPSQRPSYWKLELVTDDATRLAMTNPRRLGRIRLVDDPVNEPPIGLLGFDPLLEMPSPARFAALLNGRKAPIKAVLLDQAFSAGVGNWIADEVLYQAGIAPQRPAVSLSPQELRRLRGVLGRVIRKAVAVDADKDRFPRHWLFHYRWGRQKNSRSGRDEPISHCIVGGRTTAWVPTVQE